MKSAKLTRPRARKDKMKTIHMSAGNGPVGARRGAVMPRLVWLFLLCLAVPVRGMDVDPVLRGVWPAFACGPANAVAVRDTVVFAATRNAGLQVIDVSDPANPKCIGGYGTSGSASGVAVSGNYAYVAGSNAGWNAGFLEVIDVSNPANPRRVGSYNTNGRAQGVAVLANHAYVADEYTGLQVIDVSNPVHPQRVGGNWAASRTYAVFVTTDYVFVAAGDQGLLVLHPFRPLAGPAVSFAPLRACQNGAQVCLQGLPGLRVEIERSADLRHWQTWTNGVLGRTPLEFEDAQDNPCQFYRAFARSTEISVGHGSDNTRP